MRLVAIACCSVPPFNTISCHTRCIPMIPSSSFRYVFALHPFSAQQISPEQQQRDRGGGEEEEGDEYNNVKVENDDDDHGGNAQVGDVLEPGTTLEDQLKALCANWNHDDNAGRFTEH